MEESNLLAVVACYDLLDEAQGHILGAIGVEEIGVFGEVEDDVVEHACLGRAGADFELVLVGDEVEVASLVGDWGEGDGGEGAPFCSDGAERGVGYYYGCGYC